MLVWRKTDARKVFFYCLKQEFAPRVREIGFKGSGQNFRRVNGDIINAVNVQPSRHGDRCYVNLGLHLTFLPVSWTSQLPDPKKVKESACEFRMRLGPKNQEGYSWKYGGFFSSPTRNARHLIDTYFEYGESHFQAYDTIEKIASMLTIDDVKSEKYLGVFGGITASRGALTMARIHRHIGNLSLAKRFASLGLANLGPGSALGPEFEEILDAT